MKTLVTGATGLIGHGIVRILKNAGHQVRALVRDKERAAALLPDVECVSGDIIKPGTLGAACAGQDWIFHAAGMPEQWQADPKIFDVVNHQGTQNMLEAAKAADVGRFIYTSTMDVFAAPNGGTLVETYLDSEPKPTAYERSKQAADRAVQRAVNDGFDVVHLCPAAVYGPSPVHVGLNSFFIKLLGGDLPLIPPGGMPILFAEGCAKAHLAAAEVGKTGERYLLADQHVSNAQFAEAIVAQSDLRKAPPAGPRWLFKGLAHGGELVAKLTKSAPLVSHGQLHFMLWDVSVNSQKAQDELGFRPMALADGIALTLAALRADGKIS